MLINSTNCGPLDPHDVTLSIKLTLFERALRRISGPLKEPTRAYFRSLFAADPKLVNVEVYCVESPNGNCVFCTSVPVKGASTLSGTGITFGQRVRRDHVTGYAVRGHDRFTTLYYGDEHLATLANIQKLSLLSPTLQSISASSAAQQMLLLPARKSSRTGIRGKRVAKKKTGIRGKRAAKK